MPLGQSHREMAKRHRAPVGSQISVIAVCFRSTCEDRLCVDVRSLNLPCRPSRRPARQTPQIHRTRSPQPPSTTKTTFKIYRSARWCEYIGVCSPPTTHRTLDALTAFCLKPTVKRTRPRPLLSPCLTRKGSASLDRGHLQGRIAKERPPLELIDRIVRPSFCSPRSLTKFTPAILLPSPSRKHKSTPIVFHTPFSPAVVKFTPSELPYKHTSFEHIM